MTSGNFKRRGFEHQTEENQPPIAKYNQRKYK